MNPEESSRAPAPGEPPPDFIRQIIEEHLRVGKNDGRVQTRFPPEPNGYLHIGHAKAICLDFGVAAQYGGKCNLRMDDSNPEGERMEYAAAIQEDVRWLGFDWQDRLYFASDYYERLYEYAEQLIRQGQAYVCDLSEEEIRRGRGTITEPGTPSPHRIRSIAENLDLFQRMRAGEFPDGARVLRAKIDMAHPNMKMRDPLIYRIRHRSHYRTGDRWCIYPMYDFTHCLSDSIEAITHSLCTQEFESNRELYDWYLDQLKVEYHPQQIEFARLNISHTVLSKRRLLQLVDGGHVTGWDDPRMPTLCGLRRRGYTPGAIRDFMDQLRIAKRESNVDIALLEHVLRENLNRTSPRAFGVLRPIKVVLTNFPENRIEEMECVNNPEDPSAGTRRVPFARTLYIEEEDFREVPPPKYYRLSPGREVRLRYAYFIRCEEVVKDPQTDAVRELRCTYDPASRGGESPDGRRVKATLHWVSAEHSIAGEARLYDHLFTTPEPMAEGDDFLRHLNPASLEVLKGCRFEPALRGGPPGSLCQLERLGYFCVDRDSTPDRLVLNRTVTLRDTWAKIEQKSRAG